MFKVIELEHSKIIRHRYLLGNYDCSDLLYSGRYWIAEDDCNSISTHKKTNYRLYSGVTSPITFCPDCIQESIRDCGFGYFKAVWWRSLWCRKHQQRLMVICSKGKDLSKDISIVLSGRTPISFAPISIEHFCRVDEEPFHLTIDSSFGQLIVQVNFNYGIPSCIKDINIFNLSYCFNKFFVSWFIDNISVFKSSNIDRYSKVWLNLFDKEHSVKYRYSHLALADYATVFFNFLSQESIDEFKKFIQSYAFYDEVNDLLILKQINCSKCPKFSWSMSCIRGLDIVRHRLTPPVIMRNNVESFNRFMVRMGHKTRLTRTCEHLKTISIDSDIGSVFYLNDGNFVCSGLQPFTYTSLDYNLTLLGWVDLENIDHALDPTTQWQIDFPLYSNSPVYVVDEPDGINVFLPKIPFNEHVSWMTFMQLEHEEQSYKT